MILYIHGFNSSSLSGKAQQLKAWLDQRGRHAEYACPDLPHRPLEAIARLEDLIAGQPADSVKLIGSSLGGFYATWLAEKWGVKAALINPAVHANLLLRDAIGPQKNYSSGEEYDFTPQHLAELDTLDLPRPNRPGHFLLLVETGDAVLDYRAAVDYYRGCEQIVHEGGDHGYTRFLDDLPTIVDF
ncbi:MAG: esterase [Thiobacillaceae bacterium]|jgi:hypothetical protein|nr:esterase [Thiobacillaceae bacterium]